MTDLTPQTPLEMGPGAAVDPTAVLGYPTGRTIPSTILRIGANAHIRSGTVIYAGTVIGDDLETGHNVVIREENAIGNGFSIWNSSTVDYGCRIGDQVKIHCNVYVAQFTVLEDDVFLGPGATIANDPHPGCPEFRRCMRGPVLRRGVKVGINATILPFVEIGEHVVIGSGSVVTKDVPANSVVCGNPAKIICGIQELDCRFGFTAGPYLHLTADSPAESEEL